MRLSSVWVSGVYGPRGPALLDVDLPGDRGPDLPPLSTSPFPPRPQRPTVRSFSLVLEVTGRLPWQKAPEQAGQAEDAAAVEREI